MKKLLSVFLLFCTSWLIIGCGEDEIYYETNDELLNQNNITDVVRVFGKGWLSNNKSKTMYYGIRKGKDWFALFDSQSGALLEEWYGKERDYKKSEGIYDENSSEYYPCEQLENGKYVGYYLFEPEGTIQMFLLSDNQQVEYGFVIQDKGVFYSAITENRLLFEVEIDKYVVYDFEGDVIATDAHQFGNQNDDLNGYIGFQEDKVIIGYYDEKGTFQEVLGTEKFERNRKIHTGYGNYEEFYIQSIILYPILKTDWGYALSPNYNTFMQKTEDLFLLNNDKLIFVPLERGDSNELQEWYKGSILVDNKYVVSPEGKVLYEGFYGDNFNSDVDPISYTEWIEIKWWNKTILRYNSPKESSEVWWSPITSLYKYPDNSQITYIITNKSDGVWTYCCDILNYDGSKAQEKFKVNIETGEITYL